MGWANWIIIPKMKLVVETSRHVNEIEDYRKKALEEAIDKYQDDLADVDDVRVTDVTLKDLATLYTAHDIVRDIAEMEYDQLLLFWLDHKNIDYEIESDFKFDIKEYENNGYTIIRYILDNGQLPPPEGGGL